MTGKYRELPAWQKAVALFTKIYVATENFPENATALTAQMRRTSLAVFMNIAEAKRSNPADSQRCLEQARSALFEAENQLDLAERFGYLDTAQLLSMLENSFDVCETLKRMMESLERPAQQEAEDSNQGGIAAQDQPDPRDLEQGDESADQEVYVPTGLGTRSGWNRHPALAE